MPNKVAGLQHTVRYLAFLQLAKGLQFLHGLAQLHRSEKQPELVVMATTLIHDTWATVGSTRDLHVPVMLEDGGQ